jgi:hypothetical protein
MAEYHIGCGAFGIYAGRLNKDKTMWLQKSDVTDEAISSVAQFLVQQDEKFQFVMNGKKYEMKVSEVEDE